MPTMLPLYGQVNCCLQWPPWMKLFVRSTISWPRTIWGASHSCPSVSTEFFASWRVRRSSLYEGANDWPLIRGEDQEQTIQSIGAQTVMHFNTALLQAAVADMHELEANIVTLLKKAVVFHLLLSRMSDAMPPENVLEDEGEPSRKRQRRESEGDMVGSIAKEVVDKTFAIGLPAHPRTEGSSDAPGGMEEAWNEYEQVRRAIQFIGETCMKALHLLAIVDLSSRDGKKWQRTKRILQAMGQRQAMDKQRTEPRHDGTDPILPDARCRFANVTINGRSSAFDPRMTFYLLGAAHYLCGNTTKAIAALEQAVRGDDSRRPLFGAFYLLGRSTAQDTASPRRPSVSHMCGRQVISVLVEVSSRMYPNY